MISEPFATGNSIIHRLDPRIRVIVATLYCYVVAFSDQFAVLFLAVVISSALIISAGLGFKDVGRRLLVVNGLILFLWVVVPLTYGGQPLFQVGPLSLSRAGVILAGRITLKSNAILLTFIALVATMTFAARGYALKQLRVPDKIIHLLLMNYRYIFVLEQEYQRLITAAKIRGFQPKTNLHTYRTYAYVIGMLLVRATSRAHRVHQAMLCRGFKGIFFQSAGIQSRPGRVGIFIVDGRHHHRPGRYGMVAGRRLQVSGFRCQPSHWPRSGQCERKGN